MGKKANRFEARYLYGNRGRICGRHKREGRAHYPGRSVVLPLATGFERRRDGTTEVSRGHSRLLTGNRRAEHDRSRVGDGSLDEVEDNTN